MASKTRKQVVKQASPPTPPVPPASNEEEVTDTYDEVTVQTPSVEAASDESNPTQKGDANPPESVVDSTTTKMVTIGTPREPVDAGEPDRLKRLPWVQPKYPGMPNDGVVLGPGDPVYVRGVHNGMTVTLTCNVYRAIRPPRTKSYTFVLVHAAGTKVNADRVVLVTNSNQ